MKNLKKYRDEISYLLINKWMNSLNQNEENRLEEWKNQSKKNEDIFNKWNGDLELKNILSEYKQINVEAALRNMKIIVNSKSKKSHRNLIFRILSTSVAVILIVFSIFFIIQDKNEKYEQLISFSNIPTLTLDNGKIIPLDNNIKLLDHSDILILKDSISTNFTQSDIEDKILPTNKHTLKVPKGAEFTIVLEDGTQVWLNADSEITFPHQFGKDVREVTVSGEIYFKVNHDSSRPFLVNSNTNTVKVLGTEFNIKDYPGQSISYTTLVKGSVMVENSEGDFILKPGEQIVQNSDGIIIKMVDTDNIISWMNGMVVLEDLTLYEILMDLGRWYNFNVSYQDNSLKFKEFSGRIPRYDDIEKILKVLEQTNEVKFKIEGNILYVLDK